jgi:hypothetical protein
MLAGMPKTGRVYVNQSVSFPPGLLQAAKKRAANLGLTFSTYVQKCLERDLAERGAIIFTEAREQADLAVADDAAGAAKHPKAKRGRV